MPVLASLATSHLLCAVVLLRLNSENLALAIAGSVVRISETLLGATSADVEQLGAAVLLRNPLRGVACLVRSTLNPDGAVADGGTDVGVPRRDDHVGLGAELLNRGDDLEGFGLADADVRGHSDGSQDD